MAVNDEWRGAVVPKVADPSAGARSAREKDRVELRKAKAGSKNSSGAFPQLAPAHCRKA